MPKNPIKLLKANNGCVPIPGIPFTPAMVGIAFQTKRLPIPGIPFDPLVINRAFWVLRDLDLELAADLIVARYPDVKGWQETTVTLMGQSGEIAYGNIRTDVELNLRYATDTEEEYEEAIAFVESLGMYNHSS
jgi:hypothetical protein